MDSKIARCRITVTGSHPPILIAIGHSNEIAIGNERSRENLKNLYFHYPEDLWQVNLAGC